MRRFIPWVITSVRIISLPVLIQWFNHEVNILGILLFLVASSSDYFDGYIARKLDVTSQPGSYFDVLADFLFISCVFTVFVQKEMYPLWVLILIVIVFIQFIVTNVIVNKLIYDPIGRWYGSFLYCGLGLSLMFPEPLAYDLVTIGIVGATVASLLSRTLFFWRAQDLDMLTKTH
jgi:CDP-diacylglycerol--glycerol-3-phosphate 3-phosphatidyltransferase/cardiolipin synthase